MGEKIVGNQERGKGKEDDSSLRVCQPMPFTLEKKRNSYMPRALHDGPHKQVLPKRDKGYYPYRFFFGGANII